MHSIITHSDNIMAGLEQKIALKKALMEHKKQMPTRVVSKTKASELRSQSVLTTKTLNDIDRNLDQMKVNKAYRNDKSFQQLESEQQKLNKVFMLPPIERMAKIEKGLAKNQSIPTISGKSPSVQQKSFDTGLQIKSKLLNKAEKEELLSNYYSDKKKYMTSAQK